MVVLPHLFDQFVFIPLRLLLEFVLRILDAEHESLRSGAYPALVEFHGVLWVDVGHQ